jgi:hypothetical protein
MNKEYRFKLDKVKYKITQQESGVVCCYVEREDSDNRKYWYGVDDYESMLEKLILYLTTVSYKE